MHQDEVVATQLGEILDEAVFTIEGLARACGMSADWVQARVAFGVLDVDKGGGTWRFDGLTLVRAKRIAQLEATYDADPQLAALTADLIDEVKRLRRQLQAPGAAWIPAPSWP
jgi:chaperone modulatory protein CbpM